MRPDADALLARLEKLMRADDTVVLVCWREGGTEKKFKLGMSETLDGLLGQVASGDTLRECLEAIPEDASV